MSGLQFLRSIGFTPPVGGPIVDFTRPGSEIHDTAGTTLVEESLQNLVPSQ